MDDQSPQDIFSMLCAWYAEFFIGPRVNYAIIKRTLREHRFRDDNHRKARELFKELFRLKWGIRLPRIRCAPPLIERLSPKHLPPVVIKQTFAHGVEEEKGGMCNLLLMSISGKVSIRPEQWGSLIYGPPNISPLVHGPYYIISYLFNGTRAHEKVDPSLSDIDLILVPFVENILILKKTLERMVHADLIEEDDKNSFERKLVCYSDFVKRVTLAYAASLKLAAKPDPVARKRCSTASFTDHIAGPRRSKRNRGAPVAPLRNLNT